MSNDVFQMAVAAFSRGDLTTARKTAETLLRSNPGNPSLLQFLGVVACEAGDARQGAKLLRRAIAGGGSSPDLYFNLAKALIATGQLAEAEQIITDQRFATSREMTALRADLMKSRGDTAGMLAFYEREIVAEPSEFAAWNNLGNARHAAGDFDGALSALGEAQRLDPTSPLVPVNRARVFMSLDRYEEASLALEQAAMLAPTDPAPLLELGRLLISIDQAEGALRALGTAARLDPGNPQIFQAIGLAFTDLGELAQAERAYRFAIHADPGHAPAYVELAGQLEKANRLNDLNLLIIQAKANKISAEELNYLSALKLSRAGETAQAYELAKGVRTKALHTATLAHFLGQLADRLNRTDEAFAAFCTMNRAAADSPGGVVIDRSAYQRDIERLTVATTAEWVAKWRSVPSPAPTRAAPAFLVGFPRSGTTLLDTFLMGHSSTHVLEEVPVLETVAQRIGDPIKVGSLTAAEVRTARDHYFDELERRAPPPNGLLVIDKNPLSMIRLPLIYRLFPEAKIILAMRHPADVVLSCFMQNFKVTESMASFLDLDNGARIYDRIFTLWEKYRSFIPADVMTIRYEDIVANPSSAIQPVFQFLGLPWENDALDHQKTAQNRGYIRTPSYAQVTEPLYGRASGRWTKYRNQLAGALQILAPWCERYGYTLD